MTIDMYAREWGSTGEPVILIHGLGAFSKPWKPLAEALAAKGRKVYAVDLLGFGESPAPPGFANTMAAQADAVRDFMALKGLAKADIVGHSMGGGIALRLAEQAGKSGWPGIGKLVLLAPVAFPTTLPLDLGAVEQAINAPGFNSAVYGPALVEIILAAGFADKKPGAVKPGQIIAYAEGLSTKEQIKALIAHAKTLTQVAVKEDDLKGIDARTLIVWGKNDTFVGPSDGEKLKNAINNGKAVGNASLEWIENCGHFPQDEQFDKTEALVTNFLKT
ncbi:MAG TPA: alpha/beta hydrolase [Beijerinckiaceae bacterium]|jgi:pimeloyl-ACP methyl ester carboxylesterase